MKLIEKKNLISNILFLDLPGDHDLFGRFERIMRDSFVFDDPRELPLRIFKPVSKEKYGFNLVVSVLKEEITKCKALIRKFCRDENIDFESLSLLGGKNEKINF